MLKEAMTLGALFSLAACTITTTSNSPDGGVGTDAATPPVGSDSGMTDAATTPVGNDSGMVATPSPQDGGADGGGFGFSVSNVALAPANDGGLAGDIDITQSCELSGVDGTFSGCGLIGGDAQYIKETSSGGSVGVLYVKTLTVESAATLTISGSLPLVIVAQDSVTVFGQISVAATGSVARAGGAAVNGANGIGGGLGAGTLAVGKGRGGGSFCGAGGTGGNAIPDAGTGGGGAPGPTYGTATLVPLIAGSSGAGFSNANNSLGGAGGGALQISAKNAITVSGSISAGGGGGGGSADTSGGSGGAILLEAASVTVSGKLIANGGGGGPGGMDALLSGQPAPGGTDPFSGGAQTGGNGSAGAVTSGANGAIYGGGGGGAGWIRINTASGSATLTGATISPSISSTCASQGTLRN